MCMVSTLNNSLIDSIEIMVESSRICCLDGNATGKDVCVFVLKKGAIVDLLTLDSQEYALSKAEKIKKLVDRFETDESVVEGEIVLMNFQHHSNPWASRNIQSKLSKMLIGLDGDKHFDVGMGFHGHTDIFHSVDRVDPVQVKPNFIRWSSYSMSHQIRLVNI